MQPAPAVPVRPSTPGTDPAVTPAARTVRPARADLLRGEPETGAPWASRYRRRLRATDHAVVVATVLAATLPALVGTARQEAVAASATALALVLLWAACLAAYGSRDVTVVGSGVGEYKRVAGAGVLTTAAVAVTAVTTDLPLDAEVAVAAVPLGTVALLLTRRALRRWLTARRAAGQHLARALVVGAATDVGYVVERLHAASDSVYDVVGLVVTDAVADGTAERTGVPVVGDLTDVSRAAWRLGADSVVVTAEAGRDHEWLRELAWQLEGRATELVLAAPLAEVAGPRVHFRPVDGLPLVHVELPRFTGGALVAKRLFDVALSATALVALAPLLAVVALAVRLDDGGPVLFRQDRVGRDGRVFPMLKFRTMVVDAEARLASLRHLDEGAGLLFKLRHDPRVTRVGGLLRRWSLDELPQLWNVLRGDMSCVGPRPPLPREVDGYARHVHRRLSCTPGLTGLWQVSGRSDLGWDEGVRLDLWYVENRSLVGDLVILWRTVRVLLRPQGAY